MPVWTARCRNQDPGCVSMGAIANWGTQYHSHSFKGDLGQHLSKLGEWGVRIAQPHRSPVEATGVIEVSRTVELHHNIGPTSVGVNTFSTIVLLTLITNCDGGAFWQHNTHTSASSFFFLADSRSSKSTQDCAWQSGRLQHMIQWIPATRGTWQRPRVHMRIPEGSLMR